MSKGNAVKAILLLWTGTIFGAVCAFLTQVIAARALGPEGYGELSAGIATVTLISPLAAFGIQGLLLKIFGEEEIETIQNTFKDYAQKSKNKDNTFFTIFENE